MRHFLKKHNRVLLQIGALSLTALICTMTNGWLGIKSVLLGGISWMAPHLYFKQRMRKINMVFDIQKMLKWFFINQALKFILSFGMIVLIISTCLVDKKGFLVGYAVVILIPFFGLSSQIKRKNKIMARHQTVDAEFTPLDKQEVENER